MPKKKSTTTKKPAKKPVRNGLTAKGKRVSTSRGRYRKS